MIIHWWVHPGEILGATMQGFSDCVYHENLSEAIFLFIVAEDFQQKVDKFVLLEKSVVDPQNWQFACIFGVFFLIF